MTTPTPLPVYCVLAGDKYADHYVDRLYHMLGRHMPVPFELICLTDRPRELHPGVRQSVCFGPELEGWYGKMKLFDRAEVNHEAFLYLDATSVVYRNLGPLLEFGANSRKAVVAVEDWVHGKLNSAVMYIRPCDLTQSMWEDYRSGKVYELRYGGQQAYMAAVLKDRGRMDELEFFPPELVICYLQLLHSPDKASIDALMARALILKCVGRYKPHTLLHPRKALRVALRKPLRANQDFGFMCDFLLEHWR